MHLLRSSKSCPQCINPFGWFQMLSLFVLPGVFSAPDANKEKKLDPTHTLLRECATTQGGKGIYVDLTSCPSLLAEFSTIPSNGPIVCCPTPSPVPPSVSTESLSVSSTDAGVSQPTPTIRNLPIIRSSVEDSKVLSEENDKVAPELPVPLVKEDAFINLENLPEVQQEA